MKHPMNQPATGMRWDRMSEADAFDHPWCAVHLCPRPVSGRHRRVRCWSPWAPRFRFASKWRLICQTSEIDTQICQTATLSCFPNGVKPARQLSSAHVQAAQWQCGYMRVPESARKKFEGTGSELFLFANLDLLAFYLRPWNRVNNFATMLCESGKGSGDSTTSKLCVFKHVNKTPSPMNRWIDESLSLNIVTYRHIVILCRSGDWCLRPSVRICTARTASTAESLSKLGVRIEQTEYWKLDMKQFEANLKLCSKPWRLNCTIFPSYFPFHSWDSVVMQCFACSRTCGTKFHHEQFSGMQPTTCLQKTFYLMWCVDIDVVWVQSNNQTARNFSAQQLSKTIRTYVLIYMLNLQFCVFSPASSFISFLSVAVAGDYVIQTSMSLIMPITCNSCQREQTTSGRVRESQTSLAWLQQQSSERHFKTPNCYTFYSQLSYHGLVWLGGLERGMMGTAWNSYVREFWKSKK